MNTSIQILPGVKAIGWLYCKNIPPRVDLQAISGIVVPLICDIRQIDFFDNVECQCTTEAVNNGFEDKASLKFKAGSLIPFRDDIAIVVTDVNDRSWLIGSQEPPRLQFKVETLHGAPDGDGAGFSYDITHTAVKSLVECHIYKYSKDEL